MLSAHEGGEKDEPQRTKLHQEWQLADGKTLVVGPTGTGGADKSSVPGGLHARIGDLLPCAAQTAYAPRHSLAMPKSPWAYNQRTPTYTAQMRFNWYVNGFHDGYQQFHFDRIELGADGSTLSSTVTSSRHFADGRPPAPNCGDSSRCAHLASRISRRNRWSLCLQGMMVPAAPKARAGFSLRGRSRMPDIRPSPSRSPR